MDQYFLFIDESQKGPFTLSDLRAMWIKRSITPQTLYMQEGFENWLPIINIKDILVQSLYYYSTNDQDVRGPCAFDAIKTMVDSGQLNQNIKSCEEGTENWKDYVQKIGVNHAKIAEVRNSGDLNGWQILVWSIVIIFGFYVIVSLLLKVFPGETKGQQSNAPAPTEITHQPPAPAFRNFSSDEQSRFDAARRKAESTIAVLLAASQLSSDFGFQYRSSSITQSGRVSVTVFLILNTEDAKQMYLDKGRRENVYSVARRAWESALSEQGFSDNRVNISWGGNR